MGGRSVNQPRPSGVVIHFEPIQKQLFTKEEMMLYLGITKKSTVVNLIRNGRLTPIKITKENRYARSELDALIQRELATEKRLRGNKTEDPS